MIKHLASHRAPGGLPMRAAQAWARLAPAPVTLPPWPVLLGALALLAAALIALWTARLQAANDAAARQWANTSAQRAQAARAALVAPGPTQRLSDDQRLVAALPASAEAAARVGALLALAAAQGITVDSVRQAAPVPLGTGQAALPAERVALQVRAQGPYVALRRWVALALQQDDALLLERLRLSRPLASSTVLNADLNWALLQRWPGAAR